MNCDYGDYIIYADESGDHAMDDVNKCYPVFVLVFCIFPKKTYIEKVIPLLKRFKFFFWGHDLTVLHSSKLRKRAEDFQFLNNQDLRAEFINKLNDAMDNSPFEIISMAIDKQQLKEPSFHQNNPYILSLEHCINGAYQFLANNNQHQKLTHIIIESRGKKEDQELMIAFQEIISMRDSLQITYPLKLIFADKKTNNIGMQIADLVAYPIGRSLINPTKENPAFEITEKKFYLYPNHHGNGLKIYPNTEALEKRKTPVLSEV